MKTRCALLALAISSLPVSAQDPWGTAAVKRACGDPAAAFERDARAQTRPAPQEIPQGKALVYLFELYAPHAEPCIGGCGAIVRFGLDGQWRGAAWGNALVLATVDAGEHHLCANWQGRGKGLQQVIALQSLHAEAGKRYFFGVHALEAVGFTSGTYGFDLVPLDDDEAQMLMETYPIGGTRPR